jgi:hypothetical protein
MYVYYKNANVELLLNMIYQKKNMFDGRQFTIVKNMDWKKMKNSFIQPSIE